jgi:hypothetical protein
LKDDSKGEERDYPSLVSRRSWTTKESLDVSLIFPLQCSEEAYEEGGVVDVSLYDLIAATI